MNPSDSQLIDTLERAFTAHAGTDARIDVEEMRGVLGLRSEAIARKMFAIFDENRDGSISREEFIGSVRKLVAGSVQDRLSFAFRLHDEDGDGHISEDELRRMVALSLAEDDVSVRPDEIDEVTRTFFARADTDRDGRISFGEFESLVIRYPQLLEQMTRTEARWVAPNEDLLARLEASEKTPASQFLANRRRTLVLLSVWIAIHIAPFASTFVGGRASASVLDKLGNACTSCIELDLGILVLVAMRRLLTRVRSTWLGRVLPIDHAIAFHRIVGHSVFALAIGHGIARIVSFAKQTRRPFIDELLAMEGLTGLIALVLIAVMWWFARERIRRTRHFELFYFTHLLYLPLLMVAIVHAPAILAPSGVAIAGLIVEHALRLRRRGTEARITSCAALRSGVTRIELARPPGFVHEPGDYVFLRIPEIAGHEWHPFTLSSAPEANALVVHVRNLGNWTRSLRRLVEAQAPLRVYLDGPYGSPSRHIFETRFAVMIGAGIGVTPFASILESIALRPDGERCTLEKAHFVWLARDQYSFEWFAALLADLETEPHAARLDIHIYMTGGHAGMSAAGLEVARELRHEKGQPDLVTGLQAKTHMGHPDWRRVLAAIQAKHAPERVHVFFCGPEGLGRKIRRVAAELDLPFREEKF